MKLGSMIVENKLKIGMGLLSLTSVGLLVYWLYRKSNNTPATEPLNQIKESYDQKLTRIINQIKVMLNANGNKLTSQVIIAIIKGQYQLANEDMKTLIFNSRKERRQKIKDVLQFARMVAKCELDQIQLKQKHLDIILSKLSKPNIDKTKYNQYIAKLKQSSQTLSNLTNIFQDQQTKQLLSYRHLHMKPKDFPTIKNILNFKIKTLQVLDPNELGISQKIDVATKLDLVEYYLNDLVFIKFQTQAEDLKYSILQLDTIHKQESILLQGKINQLISNLIKGHQKKKQSDFY